MQATQSLLKTIFNLHNSKEKDKLIAIFSKLILTLGYQINWNELKVGQSEVKFIKSENSNNYAIIKAYANDSLILEEYEIHRNARNARIVSKTFFDGADIYDIQRREAIVGVKGMVYGLVEIKNKQINFYSKEKILEWLNCAPVTNQLAWQNLSMILSLQISESIFPDEVVPIMDSETLERNIEEYNFFVQECKKKYIFKK